MPGRSGSVKRVFELLAARGPLLVGVSVPSLFQRLPHVRLNFSGANPGNSSLALDDHYAWTTVARIGDRCRGTESRVPASTENALCESDSFCNVGDRCVVAAQL
jgi:hypothetical protein